MLSAKDDNLTAIEKKTILNNDVIILGSTSGSPPRKKLKQELQGENGNFLKNIQEYAQDAIQFPRLSQNTQEECKVSSPSPVPDTTTKSPVCIKESSIVAKESRKLAKQKREAEVEAKRLQKESERTKRLEEKKQREQDKLKRERFKDEERKRKLEEKVKRETEKKIQLEEKQKKEEQARLERERRELEKKKKDELRKEEEDRKRQEEENIRKKKEKAAVHFRSFFTKQNQQPLKKVKEASRFLVPFQLKENQYMAPLKRVKRTEALQLDEYINKNSTTCATYLSELRRRRPIKTLSRRRVVREAQYTSRSDDVVVIERKDCLLDNLFIAKFFQFHENTRPAYYGTWRKNTHCITGRKPFGQDTLLFNYDVDSDEEWIDEPGEDLSVENNSDDDIDEESDDDNDGFFVPHGYLSDDEGINDEHAQENVPSYESDLKKPKKPQCVGVMLEEMHSCFRAYVKVLLVKSSEVSSEAPSANESEASLVKTRVEMFPAIEIR